MMFFNAVVACVYRIAVVFSCLVVSFELFSMDPTLLTAAVERKVPLHIVTLTRVTCDKDGNVLSEKYMPISAAEAVTMFAITNAFLGEEEDLHEAIAVAHGFDEKQFMAINIKLSQQDHDARVREGLLTQLKEAGIAEALHGEILTAVIEQRPIHIGVHVQITDHEDVFKLKSSVAASKINSIASGKITKKAFIAELLDQSSIPAWMSGFSDMQKLQGQVNCFVFEKPLAEPKQKAQIEQIASSHKSTEDSLKKSYFQDNPFLFGYLSIARRDVEYYIQLYSEAVAALKVRSLPKEACIFVANELFFGKNFVLPKGYPSLIPTLPPTVLACVNFLLSESSKIPGTIFAAEAVDWSVDVLPKWIDTDDGRWPETIGENFFRSVSFYKIHERLVQEYTKSSYYQECDSALKSGYTYLFGQRSDFPHDGAFINLLRFTKQSTIRAKR